MSPAMTDPESCWQKIIHPPSPYLDYHPQCWYTQSPSPRLIDFGVLGAPLHTQKFNW